MRLRNLLLLAGAAGSIVVGSSCSEVVATPAVSTIVLSDNAVELVPEAREQLSATLRDGSGNVLARPVIWTTTAVAIATVENGLIIGRSPGTAVIVASSEGVRAEVAVVVSEGGVLTPSGNSITGFGGVFQLAVPSTAVSQPRRVFISLSTPPAPNPRFIAGTAVQIRTDAALSQPAILAIRYASNAAPTNQESLRLFQLKGSEWQEIQGSTVDVGSTTVTGPISSQGTFGVLVGAPIAKLSVTPKSPSLKVRQQLAFAIAIEDADGQPLQRSVAWSSSNPSVLTIDPNSGQAIARAPGTSEVTATAEGMTASSTVSVTAGAAAEMTVTAGDDQTGPVSTVLPVNPTVIVTDQDGFAVSGVTVVFAITSGGGSVTGPTPVTDSNGKAAVGGWTLGNTAGPNALSAKVSGSEILVTFSATAVVPPPRVAARIEIAAGDRQIAAPSQPVPIRPAVKVTDASGQPVGGATVTFRMRSGGGSITGAQGISDAAGIARIGSWSLGPSGGNSIFAEIEGLASSPLIFVASAVGEIRIVTFGDSNTDAGYFGTNPVFAALSYVSSDSARSSPSAPNHTTQLAGKIEIKWRERTSVAVKAVNHGVSGTRSGAGRTSFGAPNAREQVNGIARFQAEVLGMGYPWNGGESGITFRNGPVTRVNSFVPNSRDFAYVSIGTNDFADGLSADQTADDIGWMIDQWTSRGYAADHFILTTLAPRANSNGSIPPINSRIRTLASSRGVGFIDLTARTSDDNGATWRSSSDHIGDSIHYSETVRDWLADRVVSYMLSVQQ